MAKPGRKRRFEVPRDEHGRIMMSVYRQQDELPVQINAWNRIKDDLMRDARAPELGTLRGRMFAIGDPVKIDEFEFAAANRLAEILETYDAVVLGTSRYPRSANLDGVRRGGGREPTQFEVAHIVADLMDVESILGMAGAGCASAAKAVCRDESAALGALAARGFRALSIAWGHNPREKHVLTT